MTFAPSPASSHQPPELGARVAPFDRQRAAALEPDLDRLRQQLLPRQVRDRQVDDEHAVCAVGDRGDADLAAGVVGDVARLERQCVCQPAAAVDAEDEVGPGVTADAQLTGSLDKAEQLVSLHRHVRNRLRELAVQHLVVDVRRAERAASVREQDFHHRAAGGYLLDVRVPEEADRDIGPRRRGHQLGRRLEHRTLRRKARDSCLGAERPRRLRELLGLRRERLVDGDPHPLTRASRPRRRGSWRTNPSLSRIIGT